VRKNTTLLAVCDHRAEVITITNYTKAPLPPCPGTKGKKKGGPYPRTIQNFYLEQDRADRSLLLTDKEGRKRIIIWSANERRAPFDLAQDTLKRERALPTHHVH